MSSVFKNRSRQSHENLSFITISDLIRNSVLEKIEDDIDLKLYNQAIKNHKEDPQDISFNEMMTELGFDE